MKGIFMWIKFPIDFFTNPRVQMLSELDQRRLAMVHGMKATSAVWKKELLDQEIEFFLRISQEEWAGTKARLLDAGLWAGLGGAEGETTSPKKTSTSRVQKHRAAKHCETQHETQHETPDETHENIAALNETYETQDETRGKKQTQEEEKKEKAAAEVKDAEEAQGEEHTQKYLPVEAQDDTQGQGDAVDEEEASMTKEAFFWDSLTPEEKEEWRKKEFNDPQVKTEDIQQLGIDHIARTMAWASHSLKIWAESVS